MRARITTHLARAGLLTCLVLMNSHAAPSPRLPLFQATTTGLIGYWKLDEAAGTNAADSSPSAINGTWVGTPIVMNTAAQLPPPFGGIANMACLDFNLATQQAVSLGTNIALLNNVTGATLAGWFFCDALVTGAGFSISVGGAAPPSTTSRASLELTATGQLQGLARGLDADPAKTRQSPAGAIVTGVWCHLATTIDHTTGTIRIYKDGLEITVGVIDNGAVIGTATSATNALNAAFAANDNASGAFHDGRMDDVRVYNRALSAAEIRALCAPAPPTGLNVTGVIGANDLTWTSGQPGTVTYAVYQGTAVGGPFTLIPGAGAIAGTTFSHTGASTTAPTFYMVRTNGLIESTNSNVDSDTAIAPPPRTTTVGNENDRCNCGSARPTGPAVIGGALLVLLILALRRP